MANTSKERAAQIELLRHLANFPALGAWGMEALIVTLNRVVPEFKENPLSFGVISTIKE